MATVYKPPQEYNQYTEIQTIPIKQPLLDFLTMNAEFTVARLNETAATNTNAAIYTVPAGYVFFMIGCSISIKQKAAGYNEYASVNYKDSNSRVILSLQGNTQGWATLSESTTFTTPVKVDNGETINANAENNNTHLSASVWGFLITTSALNAFYS